MTRVASSSRSFGTRRKPRGYALVLTLVLLAIAVTAAAGVARRVNDQALQTSRTHDQVQRKWIDLSCRRYLLPAAPTVIDNAEAQTQTPIISVAERFELNGTAIDAVFSDEQAKVNINPIFRSLGKQRSQALLQSLGTRFTMPPVTLRPVVVLDEGRSTSTGDKHFHSLDQVYRKPIELDKIQTCPVTCWGDGKLNIRRASRHSLETLTTHTVPGAARLSPADIDTILQLRAEQPGIGLAAVLNQLGLEQAQRVQLGKLLTDKSSTHALWLSIDNGARVYRAVATTTSSSSTDEDSRTTEVMTW